MKFSSMKGGTGRLTPTHSQASRADHSQPGTGVNTAANALTPSAKINEHGEIEIAGRRYVRQQQLAGALGVSARTLARWSARGIGPPKITIGKTVLFDLEKLPEWLATRESAPTRNARR